MELLQRNGYRLRAPEPEDLGVMMQFENTPSLWEVSTPTGPYSRFYLKQYIETNKNDLYEDRQLRLMIESPEKRVVGIIDLFNFEPFHSKAEVGIVIGEAHRYQGIGELALLLLQEHCLQEICKDYERKNQKNSKYSEVRIHSRMGGTDIARRSL